MSQHAHDKLVSTIIERYRGDEKYDVTRCEPEAHYNYYGSRGVADLFVEEEHQRRGYPVANLVEAKSAPSDSASEIVRQIHRMNKNFFRDEERPSKSDYYYAPRGKPLINTKLVFSMTEANVEHILDNLSIYREASFSSSDILTRVHLYSLEGHELTLAQESFDQTFIAHQSYDPGEVAHLPLQIQEELVDA